MCREFSACYNDVNICLWTNGSGLNQTEAQADCQRRMSFLPLVTNSDIQSKLADFRSAAWDLLGGNGFWIGVKADENNSFYLTDGSSLAGLFLSTLCQCNEDFVIISFH